MSVQETLPSYSASLSTSEKLPLGSFSEEVEEQDKSTASSCCGMLHRTWLYVWLGIGVLYSSFMLGWNAYVLTESMDLDSRFTSFQDESFYNGIQVGLTSFNLLSLLCLLVFVHQQCLRGYHLGLLTLFTSICLETLSQTYFCLQGMACPTYVTMLLKFTFFLFAAKGASVLHTAKRVNWGYQEVSII